MQMKQNHGSICELTEMLRVKLITTYEYVKKEENESIT